MLTLPLVPNLVAFTFFLGTVRHLTSRNGTRSALQSELGTGILHLKLLGDTPVSTISRSVAVK